MKLSKRPYQNEDDYQRIRDFLRETFLLNDRRERNWHVARLDYWRWHLIKNVELCTEGLRRVKKLSGTRVFANAYDPPANALYGAALGTGTTAVW